ncbi:ankyrin repeat domain-containing protein [Candidatus Phycorickettsia trachydisci]|nr:ankyrin repeat domain-containing protein [Candidatus Phycorickettsia trachydisci]
MDKPKALTYVEVTEGSEVDVNQVYEGFRRAIKLYDLEGIRDIYNTFPNQSRKVMINDFDGNGYPLLHFTLSAECDEDYSQDDPSLIQKESKVLSIVKELVTLGVDVNEIYDYEDQEFEEDQELLEDSDQHIYPLCFAVRKGLIPVIEFLLEHGAISPYDYDREFKEPQTPLNWSMEIVRRSICKEDDRCNLSMIQSSKYPTKEIIELLLRYGANIDDAIGDGGYTWTLLGDAVQCGDVEMVKFLIDKGANVSAIQNEYGDGTLALLFREKDINNIGEIIDLLLAQGADPAKPNELGWSPLILATLKGNEKILEKLLSHVDLLKDGESPMEIGKGLLKECIENKPISAQTIRYFERGIDMPNCFFDFLFQKHDDALEIFFHEDTISALDRSSEPNLRSFISDCFKKQNYKTVVYLLEVHSPNERISIPLEIDEFVQLLDESFIYNPVKNFYSTRETIKRLISYDTTVTDELITLMVQMTLIKLKQHDTLNKLKIYMDSLNPKLRHHLNSITKEVNHEKLSSEFKSLKPIKVIMQKLGAKPTKPDFGHERELCDYTENILEQFSSGFSVVKAIYNPSSFYLFFTRNQRRFEKSEEQPEVNEKVNNDMESIISNTLSYLDFEKAADFSLILGKNFSKNLASFFTTNKELVSTNSGFDVDEHDLSCTSPVEKLPKIGEHDES